MNIDIVEKGLLAMGAECSILDWDGYGAEPIAKEYIEKAIHFCSLLPSDIPTPDIGALPYGAVCLEWRNKQNKAFDIVIDCLPFYVVGEISGKIFDNEFLELLRLHIKQ